MRVSVLIAAGALILSGCTGTASQYTSWRKVAEAQTAVQAGFLADCIQQESTAAFDIPADIAVTDGVAQDTKEEHPQTAEYMLGRVAIEMVRRDQQTARYQACVAAARMIAEGVQDQPVPESVQLMKSVPSWVGLLGGAYVAGRAVEAVAGTARQIGDVVTDSNNPVTTKITKTTTTEVAE